RLVARRAAIRGGALWTLSGTLAGLAGLAGKRRFPAPHPPARTCVAARRRYPTLSRPAESRAWVMGEKASVAGAARGRRPAHPTFRALQTSSHGHRWAQSRVTNG